MGKKGTKKNNDDDEMWGQQNDTSKGFVSYKQQVEKEKAEANKGLNAFKNMVEDSSSDEEKPKKTKDKKKKKQDEDDEEFKEEAANEGDQPELKVKEKKKKNQNIKETNLLAAFENEEDEQDVGHKRKHKKKQAAAQESDEDIKPKKQTKKAKEAKQEPEEVVAVDQEQEDQEPTKEKKEKKAKKEKKEKKPKQPKDESEEEKGAEIEKEAPEKVQEKPAGYPLQVVYCQVCGLPPEYCSFGPSDLNACKTKLKETSPALYNQLYGSEEAKPEGGDQIDSTQPAKKKKGVKMADEGDGMIVVNRLTRGQHKTICQITGFQHYTKDLKAVAKMFAKKFSVGASVAQDEIFGECISVQGDVEERLLDLLEKDADFMKLKIPSDKVDFVDGGNKKGRKKH